MIIQYHLVYSIVWKYDVECIVLMIKRSRGWFTLSCTILKNIIKLFSELFIIHDPIYLKNTKFPSSRRRSEVFRPNRLHVIVMLCTMPAKRTTRARQNTLDWIGFIFFSHFQARSNKMAGSSHLAWLHAFNSRLRTVTSCTSKHERIGRQGAHTTHTHTIHVLSVKATSSSSS